VVARLGINPKELIDSGYNANGALVFRIELDRLEKFASGVRPTGRMHDVGPPT
jgi:hypothetical protein